MLSGDSTPVARKSIENDLIEGFAYLGDAYAASGGIQRVKAENTPRSRDLAKEMAADPKNMDFKETWVAMERALAKIEAREGDARAARARLTQALATAEETVRRDPSNQWQELRIQLQHEFAQLSARRQ